MDSIKNLKDVAQKYKEALNEIYEKNSNLIEFSFLEHEGLEAVYIKPPQYFDDPRTLGLPVVSEDFVARIVLRNILMYYYRYQIEQSTNLTKEEQYRIGECFPKELFSEETYAMKFVTDEDDHTITHIELRIPTSADVIHISNNKYVSPHEAFLTLATIPEPSRRLYISDVIEPFAKILKTNKFQLMAKFDKALYGDGDFPCFCDALDYLAENANVFCQLFSSQMLEHYLLNNAFRANETFDKDLPPINLEKNKEIQIFHDKYVTRLVKYIILNQLALQEAELPFEKGEAIDSVWPEKLLPVKSWIERTANSALTILKAERENAKDAESANDDENHYGTLCLPSFPRKALDVDKLINELIDNHYIRAVCPEDGLSLKENARYFFLGDSGRTTVRNDYRLSWGKKSITLYLLIKLLYNQDEKATKENVIMMSGINSDVISDLENVPVWPIVEKVYGIKVKNKGQIDKRTKNKEPIRKELRELSNLFFSCKK